MTMESEFSDSPPSSARSYEMGEKRHSFHLKRRISRQKKTKQRSITHSELSAPASTSLVFKPKPITVVQKMRERRGGTIS